jgi:hypothetical protein
VSGEAESFFWSRQVAENVVLVGTSKDIYTLTGSFVTYPDGTIDVELRPLGVDKPPISRDVDVYKGAVAYFSSRGWIIISPSNDYVSLIHPNLQRLYDGLTRYEYDPVAIQPRQRYSLAIAKDKLWCVTPTVSSEAALEDPDEWGKRLEVYDLLQKYWRPFNYCPHLLLTEDDGTIIGFFDDNYLGILDYGYSKRLNAT